MINLRQAMFSMKTSPCRWWEECWSSDPRSHQLDHSTDPIGHPLRCHEPVLHLSLHLHSMPWYDHSNDQRCTLFDLHQQSDWKGNWHYLRWQLHSKQTSPSFRTVQNDPSIFFIRRYSSHLSSIYDGELNISCMRLPDGFGGRFTACSCPSTSIIRRIPLSRLMYVWN